MSCKLPSRNFPGTWARNQAKVVEAYQTPDTIKKQLASKLQTLGAPAQLWQPVHAATPGIVRCTCIKDTLASAQRQCPSCYGVGFVPGVLKFGHVTLFWDVAEYLSFTLTTVNRDTTSKPNKFEIAPGATQAVVVTQDKAFTNPNNDNWETFVSNDNKVISDTCLVEFSTNAGGTYTNVTAINGSNKPVGSGNIRFRITLNRGLTTDKSPRFDIIRLRRAASETANTSLIRSRVGTRRPMAIGDILILPTETIQAWILGGNVGRQVSDENHRMWTSPLDIFDTSITADTPAARIFDLEQGVHPMIQYTTGTENGRRYALFQIMTSEALGIFTLQSFVERRVQQNETYGLVF